MKVRLYLSLGLYSLPVAVLCDINDCAAACQLALSHQVFGDCDQNLDYYTTQCSSSLRSRSLYICALQHCSEHEIQYGLDEINKTCQLYAHMYLPLFSIIENVTESDIAQMEKIDRSSFAGSAVLDEPVVLSASLFQDAYRTTVAWNQSVTVRTRYGYAMLWFWIVVVLIGLVHRAQHFYTTTTELKRKSGIYSTSSDWISAIERLVKQHLLYPATFSHSCSQPVGWVMIPARLQSSILTIFLVMNITLCCISYNVFADNLYWNMPLQWSRYIGDRTGVLAIANLPLVWLFATRNNLLLWITGWSFETTMQFHRWVARISTVQAVLHSVAYTVVALLMGGWKNYTGVWSQRYWTCGAIATISMASLCVFSLYPMRNKLYEMFLFLHGTLAFVVLITMWYHVEIFNGVYNGFLWPCIIIWLGDRLARVTRVVVSNLSSRVGNVRYCAESDVVWLEVVRKHFGSPQPGSYYFLYLLHGRNFYESHPFTLSGWEGSSGSTNLDIKSISKPEQKLLFLIRPYDGFTQRLTDLAKVQGRSTGNGNTVRLLVEGPYGSRHDLKSYDSLLFVVGGTGVAVALSYLADMAQRSMVGSSAYQARRITLVWAVREQSFYEEVYSREIKTRLEYITSSSNHQIDIDIHVYVTGTIPTMRSLDRQVGSSREEQHFGWSDESHQMVCSTPSESSPLLSPYAENNGGLRLHIVHGRPILNDVLHQYLKANPSERLAIMSCGPPKMADDTRSAVVNTIRLDGAPIDFYPESYTW